MKRLITFMIPLLVLQTALLEMHRCIRALNKDSIVIIMTAFASVDTALQALKDGAFDYVTKPFDPDDLSHLIRNAADLKSSSLCARCRTLFEVGCK